MTTYLDSSAAVKLVVDETESAALRTWLGPSPTQVSSALLKVELLRATVQLDPVHLGNARDTLDNVTLLDVSAEILEDAATLRVDPFLRSLDAIHLASARRLGADLTTLVTYDRRMATAAAQLGLPVESPA
ncbi:MAG TPA: type II toxin-antitoxin system VapC family toxin [Candidatus Nanopelagicales bacterium]|jgi:hypothetical protein